MNYNDNEIIELESGKKYYVIKKLTLDNIKYVYLVSIDNSEDPEYIILKENNNHLVNLDSEEEFTKVIMEIGKELNN